MESDAAALPKEFPESKPNAFHRPSPKITPDPFIFGTRSLMAIHNKTLTSLCRREPERVREIGGKAAYNTECKEIAVEEVADVSKEIGSCRDTGGA